ncbi:MAG: hypothetical protein KVP17_004439 [Porospora cf. gigantea B]|nr:MAG: hypothetical protein KVP17_004439 [Porospora cf. gigantea B]
MAHASLSFVCAMLGIGISLTVPLVAFPLDLRLAQVGPGANSQMRLLWEIIYWTNFTLSWFVIPVLSEYELAGDLTPISRLKTSLEKNSAYLAAVLACGFCFSLVNLILGQGSPFQSACLVMSNLSGLWLVAVFLSHGLVALPRMVHSRAQPEGRLDAKYIEFTIVTQAREAAVRHFFEWSYAVDGARLLIPLDDCRRHHMDIICNEVAQLKMQISLYGDLSSVLPAEAFVPTSSSLHLTPLTMTPPVIHERTKRLSLMAYRKCVQWDMLVHDIGHLESSTERKQMPREQVKRGLLSLLSISLWALSVVVILSEATLFIPFGDRWSILAHLFHIGGIPLSTTTTPTPPIPPWPFAKPFHIGGIPLSTTTTPTPPAPPLPFANPFLFAGTFDHVRILRDSTSLSNSFAMQILTSVFVAYLLVTTYWGVLIFHLGDSPLPHHHTDMVALLFFASWMSRLSIPLVLNFLALLHTDSMSTTFEAYFGQSQLGVFEILAPLFPLTIVAVFILRLLNRGHRLSLLSHRLMVATGIRWLEEFRPKVKLTGQARTTAVAAGKGLYSNYIHGVHLQWIT